jgi:hypothetical protein
LLTAANNQLRGARHAFPGNRESAQPSRSVEPLVLDADTDVGAGLPPVVATIRER